MVGVTVISFGIMSGVMAADTVRFTQLEFTRRVMDSTAPNGFRDTRIGFDFVPSLDWIDTITISNNNENLSSNRQLQNNRRFGRTDTVELRGQANIVSNIVNHLNRGRRTNSLEQFFTRGEGNKNRDGQVEMRHTGIWTFEEISDGVWIRIVFVTPQFVVNRDVTGGPHNNGPWQVELFNPNYDQPKNANGIPLPHSLDNIAYESHVVNAIHIPLGNARDRVTRQTWYLSLGLPTITNTTSMGFTFETYGNYYNLLRYMNNIDDAYLL